MTAVAPIESDDSALINETRAEQLRLIFAAMAFGTPAGLVFALAIAVYFNGALPTAAWLAFVLSKALIAAPRMAQAHRYRTHRVAYSRALESSVLAWMFVDGLWWGVVGSCAMRESTAVVAIAAATLSSVAAVATFGLQARLLATGLYIVPILLMPAAVVVRRGDEVGTFVGAGLLVLLVLMLSTSMRSERSLAEIFRLRFLATRTSEQRGDALRLAEMRIARMEAEKALQQEKARVDALHEVLQARSAFLARISHELRSPLHGIVSALDAFEFRYAHGLAEDDELIARMRRSSMLLNAQLRDLLTLARGQVGRLHLRPEPFDACALVEGVLAASRHAARAKGIELTMTIPPMPLFVMADASRLDQVLTNLVTNSIRYTDHGRVDLHLADYDTRHRCLHVVIGDTGPGIPEDRIRGLFSPDKVLAGTERKGEASGIGLAIVGTLLHHLGASIDVRSNGTGTTFDIKVPAELIDPDAVASHSRSGARPRALVIDDLPEDAEALAGAVEMLDWHCDRAPAIAAGLNQLAAHRYDAVLVDVDLPFRSGIEIAKDIRQGSGPNRGTRLIGTSGDVALDAAGLPFDCILTKPVDGTALRAALPDPSADAATRTGAPPTPPRTPACPSLRAPSSLRS